MDSFVELVLDQLRGVQGVTWRKMFGGYGLYSGGLFFAVIWDDRMYLKTAAADEADFRARGMGPFTYEGGALKSLWEVPADVLEDADELTVWAGRAIAAARAARLAKASKRPARPRGPKRRR
ncbi:MAG TPA: TfoX/Sxy family protein [Longimicrobiales bacterium]